jgi:enamine deaminase RidA (YjgF/YER057c/UK114 family)
MSAIEQKLSLAGITLPPSVLPPANYVPYVVSGKMVFISGQLPMEGGKAQGIGKLGANISLEEGQKIARICGINILSHLKAACGGNLDKVKRCIRLGVFVNSTPEFTDQPKVANGVSDFIVEVMGEAGKHSRFAVGVAQLPLGVAVEVDGTFEIA